VNSAARLFERCSKQSRQLATRAISANSQADFHQHVITQTVRALKVFDLLARSSDDVEVVRGCMISKESFRQVLSQIQDGRFDDYLSRPPNFR
jgi:hypothetical protein